MPRIREYSGYGGQRSTSADEDETRERSYSMPESEPSAPDAPETNEEKSETAKAETASAQSYAGVHASNATSAAARGSIEKIVKYEKDLSPKYSRTKDAVASIIEEGVFYEDYLRAHKADLFESKDFLLTAIAQSPSRYFAPETPKPAEWIDEQYLTERFSDFFTQTKESVKAEESEELAKDLMVYLRKFAFGSEAYGVVSETLKRVAKVNAAAITSAEDGERMRASLVRFNESVNSALNTVKEKHAALLAAQAARAEKLESDKKELASIIDNMEFEF
ncbi:MAG: hypothetical protein FWH03_07725 [Firmicutes bacterium]|nr:hypothetical protein [Bacillota bacterium]